VRLIKAFLDFETAAADATDENLPQVAEANLGWVRDYLTQLANLARIPDTSTVVPSRLSLSVKDCAVAERMFQTFFRLWFGQRTFTDPKSGRRLTALVPHDPAEPLRFAKGREWLDSELGKLWIVEHYRVGEGGISRITVPYLPTVSACAAYVIATLMENRWGIAERVRACPFRPDPEQGFHVFLDFRLREDGNLLDGRDMRYCCAKHQNADAQRRSRKKP